MEIQYFFMRTCSGVAVILILLAGISSTLAAGTVSEESVGSHITGSPTNLVDLSSGTFGDPRWDTPAIAAEKEKSAAPVKKSRAVARTASPRAHHLASGALALSANFGSWKMTTVDATTRNNSVKENGVYTSLVLDDDDMPHISYLSPGWGGVRYATRTDDTWNLTTVAESRGTHATSIDLDPKTGYPAFTFSDSDENIGDLNYAYWDGAKWNTEHINTPVTSGDTRRIGMWNSFRFGPDGTPHVAYGSATKNVHLMYASRENGTWANKEEVDLDDAGYEPSLEFNTSGYPVIAYRTMAYAPSVAGWVGSLKFAERGADGRWKITTVDDAQNWGDTGHFPSLALDSQGDPHISYYNQNPHDASNNGLRYAYRDPEGQWTLVSVDRGGQNGQWTSIVLDDSDRPYIAYEDHNPGQLKIATPADASTWAFTPVDKDGAVGACASIALNSWGDPVISYHDYMHETLKYAEWEWL
jgi:hypothetical protein